ncbi:MAG: endonuclease III [Planctomycetota bacterium]
MKRAEKAERILAMLEELYPETPVPLDHTDPFTLLVAVLLSAQTTDARVNLVTPGLFAKGPDPASMARLSVDEILAEIRTCGLAPTKAKNVKRLSEILVDEYGGEVPNSLEELEALPGVGHKTASVVVAQAFGQPAFPVDTHIHRLAARWGLSRGKTVEHTERDLKAVFPEETWSKVHLQIIFFGREHCPARFHDLESCPICSWAATKTRVREERARDDAARARPTAKVKKKAGRLGAKAAPRTRRAGSEDAR